MSLQHVRLSHQILDSPSLHKHMSQFLKRNLFSYNHIPLVPFLWRTLNITGALEGNVTVHFLFFFFSNSSSHSLMNLSTSLTNQGMGRRNRSVVVFPCFSPRLGGIWKHEKRGMSIFPTRGTQIQFNLSSTQLIYTYIYTHIYLVLPVLILIYVYLLPD